MTDEEKNASFEILKRSPMFQLSLASKELFHSNFLAWIGSWDQGVQDKRGKEHPFRQLIKKLGAKWVDSWPDEWYVAREYNNFDLCVLSRMPDAFNNEEEFKKPDDGTNFENEEKQPIQVLLILENKLKSIPYREQLDRYYQEAEKINKTKSKNNNQVFPDCILLSMSDCFPDQGNINNWEIKTYKEYVNILSDSEVVNSDDVLVKGIINNYTEQLKVLVSLHGDWCDNETFQKSPFLYFCTQEKPKKGRKCYTRSKYEFDYPRLKELRIHDLFQKQRYAKMAATIKQKLQNINGICAATSFDEFKKKDEKNQCCYNALVTFNFIHSEPLLDIWLRSPKNENLVYTIQVQADSYEHGVQLLENIKAIDLWNDRENLGFIKNGWMRDFDDCGKQIMDEEKFKDLSTSNSKLFRDEFIYPLCARERKIKGSADKKEKYYYGKYENANSTYIYQTRKISSNQDTAVTVDEVIKYIIDDYKNLYDKLYNS